MVLGVDEEIPENILEKIRQIEDIADAVFIKF